MIRPRALPTAVLLLAPFAGAAGQRDSTVVIPDAPSCTACRIVTRKVATLGESEGPGALSSMIQNVGIDGRGRYWILVGEGPPLVFDGAGRFIAEVGRRGSGPGEVRYPMDIAALPGDSMLLFDSGRATVFDPELRPVRGITLTAGFFPVHVIEWPTYVVANGMVSAKDANGWPLHSVTLEEGVARVVKSFGPERSDLGAGGVPMLMQRIAPSVGVRFWSADWSQYRMTQWDSAGARRAIFERRPPWFPPDARGGGIGSPTTPPDPVVMGIQEDSSGFLWVFTKTAAPTWREAWPKGSGGEVEIRRLSPEKMYRTTIEVIDPRIGRVVARRVIPELIVAALPGRRAAAYVVGKDDVPRIDILRVDLTGR